MCFQISDLPKVKKPRGEAKTVFSCAFSLICKNMLCQFLEVVLILAYTGGVSSDLLDLMILRNYELLFLICTSTYRECRMIPDLRQDLLL